MQQDPDAECITNGHLLKVAGTENTKYYITNGSPGMYQYSLKLPAGVTCTQCILHWVYNAGLSMHI